jgi:hypothetical protein
MIQFTLTELDSSYAGIRVYFALYDGRRGTWRSLKLYVFSYGDTDSIVISHTGLEDVSVDSSEINSGFTPIDTTTATIINDRLALGSICYQ